MTTRAWDSLLPALDKFKAHLRITSNDLDADLNGKLAAAIRSAEHYIGMIIVRSEFTYNGSFAKTLTLESPVLSVSSVKVDGVELDATAWSLSKNVLSIDADGSTLTVVYIAGMSQPEPDIWAAILLHAAALFENPVDSVETLPKASSRLLAPYRTWGIR